MTARYAASVDSLGWLMDALERDLERMSDGARLTIEGARSACAVRRATADEASAALDALGSLGVFSSGQRERVLDAKAFAASAAYRTGVRHGIAARDTATPAVRLCAALPQSLDAGVLDIFRTATDDLRGAVVDLVAQSSRDVVLASPFWDGATLQEIGPVLARRLENGVSVRLLGRFDREVTPEVRTALARLAAHRECQLLTWYEPTADDPFGARTFHFKAAIADGGSRAYLGTANFTASGLRSRFEMGVLLEGDVAKRLARVVEAVLILARPAAVAGRG